MLSFPVFSWQGDHDAKSEILRVKCIFGTSRKILLRWGTFVNFDSFTELYQGSLKTNRFQFGNFTNFKALFSVVSTDFR